MRKMGKIGEWHSAYRLCDQWNGDCSCWRLKRSPCQSVIEAVENGETAEDERERILGALSKDASDG